MSVDNDFERYSSSPKDRGSARLARIIVADTLASLTDEGMLVETLKALTGPSGAEITSAVMADYTGSPEKPSIDARVLRIPTINVSAASLQGAMTKLLESYFKLPDSKRTAFREGLSRVTSVEKPQRS